MADQKELLRKLVDAPYGKAEEILKSEGFWDEHRQTPDGEMRTYRVRVTGETQVQSVVKVQARSAEEAEELATDMASAWNFEWRDHLDTVCIDASIEGSE